MARRYPVWESGFTLTHGRPNFGMAYSRNTPTPDVRPPARGRVRDSGGSRSPQMKSPHTDRTMGGKPGQEPPPYTLNAIPSTKAISKSRRKAEAAKRGKKK